MRTDLFVVPFLDSRSKMPGTTEPGFGPQKKRVSQMTSADEFSRDVERFVDRTVGILTLYLDWMFDDEGIFADDCFNNRLVAIRSLHEHLFDRGPLRIELAEAIEIFSEYSDCVHGGKDVDTSYYGVRAEFCRIFREKYSPVAEHTLEA